MLNIHTPLRWFRDAIRRPSRSYRQNLENQRIGSESGSLKNDDESARFATEDGKENSEGETPPSRVLIFFRGICRATGIGFVVALVLAVVPAFDPDIAPFPDRLLHFIQSYGIPIASAILFWYGVRAAR
jgi:hypothetical protein